MDFLAGKSIAVDASNFVYGMVKELVYDICICNDHKELQIQFEKLLTPLVEMCAHVYLVWDGMLLPCKSIKSIERRIPRDKSLQAGQEKFKTMGRC